jgi:hypothetical protein
MRPDEDDKSKDEDSKTHEQLRRAPVMGTGGQ